MRDTFQQAADILAQQIDFTEKIKIALSLCTQKINLSISEFFTQDALNDTVFVALLTKNINESKNRIFREYIELGKQENVINSCIPTKTFLDFMEALNTIGSKLKIDVSTSEQIKQIHHLFLYGIIGKD